MAAVGTLASGMAHEINNPNGLILLNLAFLSQVFADAGPLLEDRFRREGDFVLGGLSWPELREQMPVALDDTTQAALRIKNIVEDVKDFSRMEGPDQMDEVDLNQVVRTALHLLNGMLKKSTDRLEVRLDDNLPRLRGSAQKIEQIIMNLVMNSCQALKDRQSAVRIRTSHDGESLYFVIQDEGTGILPEHMPYLFDPFFTSKRDQGGTGLGLSISDTIAKAHHGSLEITSQWGEGTTAVLRLPCIPAAITGAAA
jgi:polar amino acid transport system substrate-binding protein